MALVDVCAVDQIADGEVLKVEITGRAALAIYQIDGNFFATDDLCTHGDASLSEGVVEDCQIFCPYHGGSFDIRSGEATGTPCYVPLRTYPVSVKEGRVYADIA